MDVDVTALAFLREHHHASSPPAQDGRPQLSPIVASVDADGQSRSAAGRPPSRSRTCGAIRFASLCVVNDGFYGEWVQLEGPATIVSLPDAMEPLVEYYRSLSGEHPDWDDYRAAMDRDERVIIRSGPSAPAPTSAAEGGGARLALREVHGYAAGRTKTG